MQIIALPAAARRRPARLRPSYPPVFVGEGQPSRADVELAIALIEALDDESHAWYAGALARLRERAAR